MHSCIYVLLSLSLFKNLPCPLYNLYMYILYYMRHMRREVYSMQKRK